MRYDSNILGEKVLNASGKEGKITKVSKEGAISVRFMGDAFDGEFMFDPFLSGHVVFVNPKLQAAVDKEIEEVRNRQLEAVNASVATEGDQETFYITKDNSDGTKEIIYKLKCSENDAFIVFGFVASEQQKEFIKSNFTIKWRVIRMFDSATGLQICQES
jgi:hypothetical protein